MSGEDSLGLGQEVELVLAGNANVTGEGRSNGELRQLGIFGVVDGAKQTILSAALVVLVLTVHLGCEIVGRGVRVKVNDGPE